MEKIVGVILAVSLLASDCYGGPHDNLKAVVMVFRHGQRNAFFTFPTDKYKDESNWEGGYAALRNAGKSLHYQLGGWFRQHYQGFLPAKYDRKFYMVISTDTDRTVMSAQSHLAGLLPPQGTEVWNSTLNWQPIPVYTVPLHEDAVLGTCHKCTKYNVLHEAIDDYPEFRKRWNTTMNDYIKKHSGKTIKSFWSYVEIYDSLFVEQNDFKYALPDWTKEVYPEPLTGLAALVFGMFAYTTETARLITGPFLHTVLAHFDQVRLGKSVPKYHVYSGHDQHISNLQVVFGVYENIKPPYAATIILELRQNPTTKKHFVNILYKNQTDVALEPNKLTMKGCQFDCDLDKFKNLLAPVLMTVDEWKVECGLHGAGARISVTRIIYILATWHVFNSVL